MVGITAASAKTGKNNGGTTSDAGGDGTTYTVHVSYTHRGTGGEGSQPMRSSNANFVPPVCWYQSFTPEEFEQEIKRRYYSAGNSHTGTVYDYYNQVQSQMNEIKYHRGDDGSWWVLAWDETQLDAPGSHVCPYDTGWLWQGPGDPAPPLVISPEVLALAAYGQMTLPAKGVALNPVAGNQKVNLATYVSFQDAVTPVSVTAQLDAVAATVVAVPYSLHVDAGTSFAEPRSCDYRFTSAGGGYEVDSADEACNVTYRKATASGDTYPLRAEITWRVTWTPTADPRPGAGQGLPGGYSDFDQPVTVQEIQTVNR
jgi:enoyl reductase